jgi:hypothetical protein
LERLFQEVGYIAYHFHWPREEILSLAHGERHRWVKEISEINKKINLGAGGAQVATKPAAAKVYEAPKVQTNAYDIINTDVLDRWRKQQEAELAEQQNKPPK